MPSSGPLGRRRQPAAERPAASTYSAAPAHRGAPRGQHLQRGWAWARSTEFLEAASASASRRARSLNRRSRASTSPARGPPTARPSTACISLKKTKKKQQKHKFSEVRADFWTSVFVQCDRSVDPPYPSSDRSELSCRSMPMPMPMPFFLLLYLPLLGASCASSASAAAAAAAARLLQRRALPRQRRPAPGRLARPPGRAERTARAHTHR
ncbi:unnamed protein product [Prorocentrum cordatum]|uniref:Uncharacterized protein n=1 Tax=Prorocentrum cordatum TaxID=2364126 RepID=A0ABN9PPY9_9DINO|nr:unnamed protein product [Polarella glacialis]